jgi:NAD(P)-dependent dehydrogenase (short-subunit alcohol dehydrogenase family)
MQMTRMLAYEWAEHGIRVNAIAPGRVNTPSRELSLAQAEYRQRMIDRVPLKRFAESSEVAAAVCYLASPAAEYITGQTLVLDGGLTAY